MNHISAAGRTAPANDNVQPHRWPVLEEHKAGRIPDNAWDAAIYIADCWNEFLQESESYFAPGAKWISDSGRHRLPGNPLSLRGPEVYANFSGRWRYIAARLPDGELALVLRALVGGAEMRDLAPPGTPRAKRAKAGRARLIAALPLVAEEIRQLDLADAA